MRHYNKYFRQRNPSKRRVALTGDRKRIHDDLFALLSAGARRRKNPGDESESKADIQRLTTEYLDSARSKAATRQIRIGDHKMSRVVAFNFLGRLNEVIALGNDALIPLRDTVEAAIEGYMNEDVLDYNLYDAITNLGATQARVVRQMVDDAGGEVSPREKSEMVVGSRRHPDVRAAKKKVDIAAKYQDAIKESVRRGQLSQMEWSLGEGRAADITEADAYAAQLLGTGVKYEEADPELWRRVRKQLQKKYPQHLFENVHFVPSTVPSVMRREFTMLVKMKHPSVPREKRQTYRRRLQASLARRWEAKMIQAYEAAGGRELSEEGKRVKKAQEKKDWGVPYPLGNGLFGLMRKTKDGVRWFLVSGDASVYMKGDEVNKSSASRSINRSREILLNILRLGGVNAKSTDPAAMAGWDDLPKSDTKWLAEHKPKISKEIATILISHIGETTRPDNDTKRWLIDASDIKKAPVLAKKKKKKKTVDMVAVCEALEVGQEAEISAPKGRYIVHVKKVRGDKPYHYCVEIPGGKKSAMRRSASCDLLGNANAIAGKMLAKKEAERKIVANPSRRTHKTCRGMRVGDERIFAGEGRKYLIHVKRGRSKKTPYSYCVETADGRKSSTRRTSDCSDVILRGHVIGGAMVGAGAVAKAAKNPAKLKRLESQAKRGLRKANPRQRIEASAGDIAEMRGIYQLPNDPEEAAKYGYYMGVIKGIDTCGVQNYMARRRIRKAYRDRLAEGEQEFAAGFSGTKIPKLKKRTGFKMPKFVTRTLSGDDDEGEDEDDLLDEESIYVEDAEG